MLPTNLDMDVLRTLVVAIDMGGFARAANRLGRSQSAVSLQMKKLEDQVGKTLFRKSGRGLALTDAGDVVLGYARRILEINDEAVAAARGIAREGSVRVGIPQDLAEKWLPIVLRQFHAQFPETHLEIRVGRNRELRELVSQGHLDLALVFGELVQRAEEACVLAELPMVWVGKTGSFRDATRPLSLALLDNPCMFRQAGIDALDQTEQNWRIGFTTPSLSILWAAVGSGLGISVRTPIGIPDTLEILSDDRGLPELPRIQLELCSASGHRRAAVDKFRDILISYLPTALGNEPHALAAE